MSEILAVQLGFAATASDLKAARTQSHDKLIADLGERRRSGVEWRTFGAADTPQVLDDLGIDVERGDVQDWLTSYPNGFLVVASAEAVEP